MVIHLIFSSIIIFLTILNIKNIFLQPIHLFFVMHPKLKLSIFFNLLIPFKKYFILFYWFLNLFLFYFIFIFFFSIHSRQRNKKIIKTPSS